MTILNPLMASRIMLSLKEAASEPVRLRPHFNMITGSLGMSTEGADTRFATQMSVGLSGVQTAPMAQDLATENIELGPPSRSPREVGHPC